MKKNLVVALVVLLIGGVFTSAKAQENVVKINIFSPIVKTFNMSYERKVSATGSFQIGAFFTSYSPESTSFSGFGVTPEYRFYLSESEAPAGFYVAPFARYQSFKVEDSFDGATNKGTLSLFGGGVVIGKQWIFKEKISLDIFIGPQYSSGNVKVTDGADTFDTGAFDGFGVRTGVTLGFAF
ncbi:MAG TPA: hypothetical protein DHV26_09090 [Cytophagales bacterium]|nr:hypothetical protein [Cytophagales bacterium]